MTRAEHARQNFRTNPEDWSEEWRRLFAAPISGASMNPARSFGPDLIGSQTGAYWIYAAGPVMGALLAVGFAWVLHGKATPSEVAAALGQERRREEASAAQPSRRSA